MTDQTERDKLALHQLENAQKLVMAMKRKTPELMIVMSSLTSGIIALRDMQARAALDDGAVSLERSRARFDAFYDAQMPEEVPNRFVAYWIWLTALGLSDPDYKTPPQRDGGAVQCSMGVGCDEVGVCYADAHGQPECCPRIPQRDGGAVSHGGTWDFDLSHKVEFDGCPFCGSTPTVQSWHGGAPTKVMISCENEECAVAPNVTGENETEAAWRWNKRAALRAPSQPSSERDLLTEFAKWSFSEATFRQTRWEDLLAAFLASRQEKKE